ncbi:hypothetical protein HK096_010010 [Nowakowskiella sp. JEL0078]|nr:hypothetical protein HK096_010010 [Nowakowskiella sp. JEL0078]
MSCSSCKTALNFFNRATCESCSLSFCTACLKFAITTPESGDKILSLCKSCYVANTNLDLSNVVTVLEASNTKNPKTVLFVHGGGGCRLMFLPHAEWLAQRGFRCILMDLPGHGARFEDPLSLETAFTAINETSREYGATIYVGGSLGGYIGMEFLGRHPEVFEKAVIAMCGQNVGVGRGWAAGIGLWGMGAVIPSMSPATLLKGMQSQAMSNGHISKDILQDTIMRCGCFFGQGSKQVEILSGTDSKAALEKYDGPVLFINGSKDHHDSDKIWLAACKNQDSKLEIYEGADHFFSHDDRFMNTFMEDTLKFITH